MPLMVHLRYILHCTAEGKELEMNFERGGKGRLTSRPS